MAESEQGKFVRKMADPVRFQLILERKMRDHLKVVANERDLDVSSLIRTAIEQEYGTIASGVEHRTPRKALESFDVMEGIAFHLESGPRQKIFLSVAILRLLLDTDNKARYYSVMESIKELLQVKGYMAVIEPVEHMATTGGRPKNVLDGFNLYTHNRNMEQGEIEEVVKKLRVEYRKFGHGIKEIMRYDR